MALFNEAEQIVCSRNGVTMLKPHWMSQEYWQNYMVPRCGKAYHGGKGQAFVFGARITQSDIDDAREREQSATDDGDCVGCKI